VSQETILKTMPFDAQRKRITTASRMWQSLLKAKTPIMALVVLGIVVFCAITAEWITPYKPDVYEIQDRLMPPAWMEGGHPEHLLGTDTVGRDVFTSLIYGARISIFIGIVVVLIAGAIGISLGLLAGFFGGLVDDVIMRLADIQLAFPFILLAISVLAVLMARRGADSNLTVLDRLVPLILTLGIAQWVSYARMARSMTLSLREKEFVEAARALGDSKLSIIFRNILPNALAPLIVLGSFNVASTILAEASLSFLGLGVPPTIPTWGGMLNESREFLLVGYWWLAIIPGLAIVVTVLAINIIGDWLRDFYDPRLRT
jgi:peptide/nickel transport system permease protein